MEENICKGYNWQGINLQNIRIALTIQQYKKEQTTQSKNGQKT